MHAGLMGFSGISAEGIESGFGWAHNICQDMIRDATEAVCDDFRLFTADPSLRQKLEETRKVVGTMLAEKRKAVLHAQKADPSKS
jgi:hypothetical protein